MTGIACDLWVKITPKTKRAILKALIILMKANAVDKADAKEVLDNIGSMDENRDKLNKNLKGDNKNEN